MLSLIIWKLKHVLGKAPILKIQLVPLFYLLSALYKIIPMTTKTMNIITVISLVLFIQKYSCMIRQFLLVLFPQHPVVCLEPTFAFLVNFVINIWFTI